MARAKVGDAVFTVSDQEIGTVSAVRECCMEIADGNRRRNVVPYAISTAARRRVTLLCESNELKRYACVAHP